MDFNKLKGMTLTSITGLSCGSGEAVFENTAGQSFRMFHYQDCCESVRVEDVCGDVADLVGTPIVRAEQRSNGTQTIEGGYGDVEQWTFYELATIRGSVTVRWYGTSNGYYSTSVDFEELTAHDQARAGTLVDGDYEVETVDVREWWLWDQESWRNFAGEVLDLDCAHARFGVLGPALRR